MTKEQIITTLYGNRVIERTSKALASRFTNVDDYMDFVQDMYVVVCSMPEAKMRKLQESGDLERYVAKTVINQAVNPNSKYRRQFRLEERNTRVTLNGDKI